MQITPSSLDAIYYGYSKIFQDAYNAAEIWWDQLATRVPSMGAENRYAWMAAIPKMREWLGDRVVQNVAAHGFSVVNKDFELTLELDRNAIEDDQIGFYNPTIAMMGEQTRKYPDDLVLDLLQNGQSRLCFDGQYFFDTDHPVDQNNAGAGTQQNYWSSGKALTFDNYAFGRSKMRAFRGANGRPLGVRPNLLIVPPALEATAKLIVTAEYLPSTAGTAEQPNVYRDTAKVLVIDELDGGDTTWFLADTRKPIKPFVFQDRQAPRFYQETSPDSESVKRRKKFTYGVDTRGNAGFALWFLAAKFAA